MPGSVSRLFGFAGAEGLDGIALNVDSQPGELDDFLAVFRREERRGIGVGIHRRQIRPRGRRPRH